MMAPNAGPKGLGCESWASGKTPIPREVRGVSLESNMSRKHYTAKMPWGEAITISADLVQASANIAILIDGEEDRVDPTPYQTADARHRTREAVMLAVAYCGREWYAEPTDHRDSSRILAEIEKKIKITEEEYA